MFFEKTVANSDYVSFLFSVKNVAACNVPQVTEQIDKPFGRPRATLLLFDYMTIAIVICRRYMENGNVDEAPYREPSFNVFIHFSVVPSQDAVPSYYGGHCLRTFRPEH